MDSLTLKDLLEKPFKSFTLEEQLEIVRRGRFTNLTEMSHTDKGKRRTFWSSWYQKVKWLTGDVTTKKLFCWNCILFPTPTMNKTWSKVGFDDLRNLSQATRKHEESREHVYATIKLRLLAKKTEKKIDPVDNLEKNVEVKRNREYLERLIDISSTLGRLEMPFRGENEEGLYADLVYLLKKYDDIVRTQLEQCHTFHGLSPTIQVDLVQSIEQVLLQKITDEVSASSFLSVMVDEVSSNSETKHMSISIRYVKNGEPVERFVKLFGVGHTTKAEEIAAILDKELERFNYKDKMVSQSYDGKVVKATDLYSLQQAVKRNQHSHCQAQLVHYYAHDFCMLLAQALNSVQECKLFFSVILVFCKFFQSSDLHPDKKRFDSIPSCIATLKAQYDQVLRLLQYFTTDELYKNRGTLIADAVNLINHLQNFRFMVFVAMFDKYFSLVNDFAEEVKGIVFNAQACRKLVNTLTDNLKVYQKRTEFDSFIPDASITRPTSLAVVDSLFTLNVHVLDSLIHEVWGRFLDIELGDFFGLVGVDKFEDLENGTAKPDMSLFLSIRDNYPKFFDTAKLKIELQLLYTDPTIGGFGEHDIKQVRDLLKFIHYNDLKEHIPELYKLLELVVTIPSVGEPLEGRCCVLNRIDAYRNSERKEEPLSGLAMLTIEKDLLVEMGRSEKWYGQVIDQFAKLPSTSSIELMYKDDGRPTQEIKVEWIAQPDLEIKTEPDYEVL
ncbi:hypothetical protein NQ315_001637 [Exocentrus adspersus]|uniref:Uncharacterized protein n=1 Tax=Exocentrus adspersus TaxID=1586481 RepID=A0AAV8WA44_9CUCU|nr:hypothetical protein NQ315_001637 [Exocentrus adspersus]